ncbi:MAG: translation initiation factor IF-2 N-terminal domain-containing protein, partial [Eubacteriales bacterium]|nr:translation initiation factor IF-2 N-terminal domain-containing protein [Eubacteriales bacterium]
MSKKVYEIAKGLEMDSKELLEKINAMGIEAKTHNSVLSDIDATSVENMIHHNRKKAAETKIVMAAPSVAGKTHVEDTEVRIAVKQATMPSFKPKEKVEQKPRTEQPKPERLATPPVGKPLPKSTMAQPPVGTPMLKSASQQPVHENKDAAEAVATAQPVEQNTIVQTPIVQS